MDANDQAKTEAVQSETIGPIGPLSLLILPPQWQKAGSRDNARGYVYSFSPPGDTEVTISVSYNVPPLSDSEAQSVSTILKKEPHTVSREELSNLYRLLREKIEPDEFTIESASTQNVGSKRVLLLTGTYKKQLVRTFTLYNQAQKDPSVVQALQYTAPQDKFAKHEKEAREAILKSSLR